LIIDVEKHPDDWRDAQRNPELWIRTAGPFDIIETYQLELALRDAMGPDRSGEHGPFGVTRLNEHAYRLGGRASNLWLVDDKEIRHLQRIIVDLRERFYQLLPRLVWEHPGSIHSPYYY
jgi:hypothetical protein